MGIQTYKTAYYFPTRQDLDRFLQVYGDDIGYIPMMKGIYNSDNANTFDFYKEDDEEQYDWDYSIPDWYRRWKYRVIIYSKQRTE